MFVFMIAAGCVPLGEVGAPWSTSEPTVASPPTEATDLAADSDTGVKGPTAVEIVHVDVHCRAGAFPTFRVYTLGEPDFVHLYWEYTSCLTRTMRIREPRHPLGSCRISRGPLHE